jgi:hypothetical protein
MTPYSPVLIKGYIWTVLAVDQKHLEIFQMWCWRRTEKISWTDHVRSEEASLTVKEQRNILHEIIKWKVNLIGHILRINCLLRQVIEGNIKGRIKAPERRGRRRRKLLEGEERILTSEGESSRSHYVYSWLWKRLWTFHEIDY